MEKPQFLGLRTTIYKVGDITEAKNGTLKHLEFSLILTKLSMLDLMLVDLNLDYNLKKHQLKIR